MRWLIAATTSLAIFWAVSLGTLVPLRNGRHIEYLFAWSGAPVLASAIAATAVVLGVAYWWISRRTRPGHGYAEEQARAGTWLAALTPLSSMLLGVVGAAPGAGDAGTPLVYLFYDLRWWWFAVCVIWTLRRADALLGDPLRSLAGAGLRWSPRTRMLALDCLIVAVLAGTAVVTQPKMRFFGGTFGDEPKYIRYCETWYQGRGIDVSSNVLMADAKLDADSHVLRNVSLLISAVVADGRDLATDLRHFLAEPLAFRWNRVPDAHNGFVTGKHGTGMYQLHQPGMSLFLFPGYFVDRHFLGLTPGYQGEFPADLPMTTSMVLALYAVSGAVLFRLLRRALQSVALAWWAALLAMLTFPTSAFAFQFYPEIGATLLLLIGVTYVWFHAPDPHQGIEQTTTAVLAGVVVGWLAWMHPRFLLIVFTLMAAGTVRAHRRGRAAFLCGCALPLVLLGAYAYHITGSWLPNALYAASPDEHQIVLGNIIDNLISYAIHGEWGLMPHAPWLLFVVPGLAYIARRQFGLAAFLAIIGLDLGALAAGHALNPAGGTPGRFVVAVVPLLIWPAMLVARHHWQYAAVRVTSVIMVVLSLDAAWAYNWSHEKAVGPMVDASVSGWKLNLAFPEIREYFIGTNQTGYPVVIGLVVVTLALSGAAWWSAGRRRAENDRTDREDGGRRTASLSASSTGVAGLVVSMGVVLWCVGATMVLGRWSKAEFVEGDLKARRRAALALVSLDRCRVCFTSSNRQIDWVWLKPNPAKEPRLDVRASGADVEARIELDSADGVDGFARAMLDFGDGSTPQGVGVVGRTVVSHRYREPGEFRVQVTIETREYSRSATQNVLIKQKG